METIDDEDFKSWGAINLFKCIKDNNSLIYTLDSENTEYNAIELNILDEYRITNNEKILHEYRNKINDYEKDLSQYNIKKYKNWEYYKKIVNPYELIYTQKKYNDFPDSVCILKPLSRSYFKMIEMLHIINFFNTFKDDKIRTAHVCEGPGGFIEALYDEAIRNRKHIVNTVAMTLKSKETNIPGWRRATNFLQKNRAINIIYGEDDTGDIMKLENQQYYIDYCINYKNGGKVNIFTADGGFDFSCDYKKQEKLAFPLLLASSKMALEVLKKGGVYILKLFDCYNKQTVDLIYILSQHFNEWTLYKPATSRPCNPEQYFIGKGYTGCSNELLDVMRLWCTMIQNGKYIHSLLHNTYTDEFKNIIEVTNTYSFNRQINYLKRVFDVIDNNDENIINEYLKRNEKISYKWCIDFKMPISLNRSHLV